jgi:hypothetical protein
MAELFEFFRRGATADTPESRARLLGARKKLSVKKRKRSAAAGAVQQADAVCAVCQLMDVSSIGDVCGACLEVGGRKKLHEAKVLELLMIHERFKHFTFFNTSISCDGGGQIRPDLVWVLDDRVVLLEIDEHGHRAYNPVCERNREFRILDAVSERAPGKQLVIVRHNPHASCADWLSHKKLIAGLDSAFDDVHESEDGIARLYVNYTRQRMREISKEFATAQRGALAEARDIFFAAEEDASAEIETTAASIAKQCRAMPRADLERLLKRVKELV